MSKRFKARRQRRQLARQPKSTAQVSLVLPNKQTQGLTLSVSDAAVVSGFISLKVSEILIGKRGLADAHAFLAGVLDTILSLEDISSLIIRSPFVWGQDKDIVRLPGTVHPADCQGQMISLISADPFLDLLPEDLPLVSSTESEQSIDELSKVIKSVEGLIVGAVPVNLDNGRSLQCISLGQTQFFATKGFKPDNQGLSAVVFTSFLYLTACLAREHELEKMDFLMNCTWNHELMASPPEEVSDVDESVEFYTLCRYRVIPFNDAEEIVNLTRSMAETHR